MTEEEKRALLEEARVVRLTLARIAAAMACEPDDDGDLVDAVRMLVRERDEARAQVKAWQDEELERRRERDEARAELDHMRQGYDRVRADRDYHCDRAIAAVAERDALAAQLAALRAEVHGALSEPHAYIGGRERSVLTCALGAAATAEAHDRRVRAEALREAAATCSSRASEHEADIALALADEGFVTADRLRFRSIEASEIASKLRARADEIEEGR